MKKFKDWISSRRKEAENMLFPPMVDKSMLKQHQYKLRNNEIAKVRFATEEDLEDIIKIQKECYDGEAPWGRIAVMNELKKRTSFFLICHHLELPISFIGISVRHEAVHVTNIATIPAYERHGLATFLLLTAAEIGKKMERKTMTLEVRISNEGAKRLYRKIGFQDGRIKRNYYHNNGEDALEMSFHLSKLDEFNDIQQAK
ncbi:MAG TPA: ribosomal protein S18-alanine N-acetyltransferase [Atopostipes sp.]|nr:ribosomal protein S18-alanine N-acetyltransferase [Atopostipes sp.]